ncbi:MAG: RHS repeat-associated core domain-containing protein [Candidatus Eiseniibacteriota bacterium]
MMRALVTATATDSATYDAQDRLTSRGVMATGYTRYTYTAAGELRSVISGSNVTRLEYDPLGNLVRDTLASGDIVQYSSDGAGRRVGRRMNGAWSGGWVYQNALNVAGELDQSGAVIRRYVYGVEPHVPALMLEGSATYRLITDQLGSVRGVVDVSSGAIVQKRDYDAWGVVTLSSGTNTQALGYAGGLSDASTSLVRFGARDYDPVAGRWTAKDPVGFGGGDANLYCYGVSEPVNHLDPDGKEVVLAVVGAVLGGSLNAVHNYRAYASGSITGARYAESIAFGAGAGALSGLVPGVGGVIASSALAGLNEANNEASSRDVLSL